ncbi:MAG: 3-oxoacyl-ACP reductase [Nevskia sp.]|nr:3-oxoacyl-ACP reductase [Nevskia sp.]
MSDRYLALAQSPLGRQFFSALNLPAPPRLARELQAYGPQPLAGKTALVAGVPQARHRTTLEAALRGAGASLSGDKPALLLFDASGATGPAELKPLYAFFHERLAGLPGGTHVVVIGRAPASCDSAAEAAAAGALSGFVKSLAKEIGRKGATANLVTVADGAEAWLGGALRFLLSGHAAFVTGQTLPLTPPARSLKPGDCSRPLDGKTALVTGAARGIGAAIARSLAREGAHVIGVDRPQEEAALQGTLAAFDGKPLLLDVTAADAGERIAEAAGQLDLVVHNAGVTRDKLLRNMPEHFWDMVLGINLEAIVRINEQLLAGALAPQARMVCISSIGGIAGNAGQTNYAATKSGVISYVAALAAEVGKRGMAINAVAPGFIETQMTASIPPANRFFGRRMSALLQGGLPEDIAEAVTFLGAAPLSGGVNGVTLRVCGQNWLGA